MARLQSRVVTVGEESGSFPQGRVEIFDLGDLVVGRSVFDPGWRWSVDVKPNAGTELCEYHHLGVVISGLLHVVMASGAEVDIGPGAAFEMPPGHDAWVVGDEPWISLDFAGMRSYGQPIEATGERVLATILFTDIVDSTPLPETICEKRWRELLGQHDDRLRFPPAPHR